MESTYDLIVVGTGFASSFFLKRYLELSKQNIIQISEAVQIVGQVAHPGLCPMTLK